MVISETVLYVINTNNTQNIKEYVLLIIFLYSILAFFLNDKIDANKSYMHYWAKGLSKIFAIGYLMFSPLLYLFLLNVNITMEIFILIIVGLYLMFIGLFIGMSVHHGSSEVLKIFGVDSWAEYKDKKAERASKRKYG